MPISARSGQRLLDIALEPPPVEPRAVGAAVHDEKTARRPITPHMGVLARNLLFRVQRQVHRIVVRSTPDSNPVLRHQKELGTALVLVPDIGIDPVGLLPRVRSRPPERVAVTDGSRPIRVVLVP